MTELDRCPDCSIVHWVRRRLGHDYRALKWTEFFSPSHPQLHLSQGGTPQPLCLHYAAELGWAKAANPSPAIRIGYLAHPVSAATEVDYYANLDNASDWLRFLQNPDHLRAIGIKGRWEVSCPWWADAMAYPYRDINDGEGRRRQVERCTRVAALFHGVFLCGGRKTAGMQLEEFAGREIFDLTHLGEKPPWSLCEYGHDDDEEERQDPTPRDRPPPTAA